MPAAHIGVDQDMVPLEKSCLSSSLLIGPALPASSTGYSVPLLVLGAAVLLAADAVVASVVVALVVEGVAGRPSA